MPCLHKFHNELALTGLNYEPTTLIVGTFNPTWPGGNYAEWFYGRTANNCFWDVLPRIYEGDNASLVNAGPNDWKNFCRRNRIAITDLIYSINDANEGNPEHIRGLGNYSDSFITENFQEFTFVEVVDILAQNPTIQHIYLTRSAVGFWAQRWQPVMNYAALNGKTTQTLLTPSKNARFQHGRWNRAHPNHPIQNLADYILMRWQEVWHQLNNH